jgi:hypothetical protein
MKSAVLEKSVATGVLDTDRLRAFVLVRIACAADGVSKTDLAADLAPLVAHRLAPAQWRTLVERESVALADAGLVSVAGTRLRPSEAGIARAAIFLGLKGARPRSW